VRSKNLFKSSVLTTEPNRKIFSKTQSKYRTKLVQLSGRKIRSLSIFMPLYRPTKGPKHSITTFIGRCMAFIQMTTSSLLTGCTANTYTSMRYIMMTRYNVSSSIYDEERRTGRCSRPFSQVSAVAHEAPSETQFVISPLFQNIHWSQFKKSTVYNPTACTLAVIVPTAPECLSAHNCYVESTTTQNISSYSSHSAVNRN